MKTDNIEKQWEPYAHMIPAQTIIQALSIPQSFLHEEITHILPNIQLDSNGPNIKTIIFLSDKYIGEAELIQNASHFDIAVRIVTHLILQLGFHEIVRNAAAIAEAAKTNQPIPSPDRLVYQTAKLTLRHGEFELRTEISYFGTNRDVWLNSVRTLFPSKEISAVV